MTDAPVSYNNGNHSKQSDKYNTFHHHLVHEIRDIRETKQLFCTNTYLVGYLLKSIGQHE